LSEQIDIAVDLGVVPPPLPEIMSLRQLVEAATAAPPQIIEGVVHQGCKMVLGDKAKGFSTIIKEAEEKLGMSRRTVARYLARLTEAGVVAQSGGLY